MTSDKRRVIITIVSLAVIGLVAVCLSVYVLQQVPAKNNSSSANGVSQSLTASDITQKVISKMGYEDLKELNSGNIANHFVLPEGSVTQASIYISLSADSALELSCFKPTGEESLESLNAAVAQRMQTKAKGFKDTPTQLSLIDNYVSDYYNGYVFVAVAPNAESAAKTFRDILDGEQ